MNRFLVGILVYSLLIQAVWAEQPEAITTGSQAGKTLGDQAFLLKLVSIPTQNLRVGWLPAISLDHSPLPAEFSQADLNRLNQIRPDWSWQYIDLSTAEPSPKLSLQPSSEPAEIKQTSSPEDPQQLPYNQQILKLADQLKLDLILSPRIQKVADEYWILVSLFSGADGSVLANWKFSLKNLQTETLLQELVKKLQEFDSVNFVKDLNLAGGELHLRTSPLGLQSYLNDIPLGLSPLIVRQLPGGAQTLHLFELEPYSIDRIRIVSEPPGITVSVHQRELGKTPLEFPAELLLPGDFEIQLKSEASIRFKAEIQIQTTPDNIPVQLNSLPIKRTPVSFQELSDNSYSLHLPNNHAIDITLPLELVAGDTKVLEIDAYKYSRLIINSNVANAQLTLNNEVVGETPFSSNLPQGLHRLKISKNRYRTQERLLELIPGQTHEITFDLKHRSADSSIFLTPTGELTPQFNIGAKYLGFGNLVNNNQSELAHLYGLEVDYGWPAFTRLANTFDLGLEVSAFFFGLQTSSQWRSFQGLGSKLQFLRESDNIPISAAIGAYANLDLNRPKLVGYLSLSRNFGDFALHLGLQTHGFNLNAGYTGWDNIRLGLLIYADSFFRLLSDAQETSTTFYGLQLGYSF